MCQHCIVLARVIENFVKLGAKCNASEIILSSVVELTPHFEENGMKELVRKSTGTEPRTSIYHRVEMPESRNAMCTPNWVAASMK
jgi:hypothetical protein